MKQLLIIGGVIIVILGGVYFFMQNGDGMDVNDTDDAMTTDEGDMDSGDSSMGQNGATGANGSGAAANSVMLAENEGGNIAKISYVSLDTPGFVVIYRVKSNGDSTFLGSTDLLQAGTHTDLSVQSQSPLIEEETLVAVLHEDTDGDGRFDEDGDLYLNASDDSNTAIVTDVDVVAVDPTEESETLAEQVDAYIESELRAEADAEADAEAEAQYGE